MCVSLLCLTRSLRNCSNPLAAICCLTSLLTHSLPPQVLCVFVCPYPIMWCVCLCVQTMTVSQPSWTRRGRVGGVISKAQHQPCLRLIGSCSCQMCTCGTYFSPEVSLAEGVASFRVHLLSGHPSWSYVRMILFQNAFIHWFRASILVITIQKADWNPAHESENKTVWIMNN